MKNKNKKICLLLTGGTTISDHDIKGSSVEKKEDTEKWFSQLAEITLMAKIEPVFICADKDMMGVNLWQKLSQEIYERINDFDGFVVLSSPDLVLDNAIALSFALENLNKPVIFTSSQITKEAVKHPYWQSEKTKAYGGLGIKANLINAVHLATMDLSAIVLMFGNRIIRAVKGQRVQALGFNPFASADNQYLGKIDFGISLSEKIKQPVESLKLKNQFEEKIQILGWLSGSDAVKSINSKTRGIIIRDVPNLEELVIGNKKIPILIYNRFSINNGKNSRQNIIIPPETTWETAVIKFMWALGQKDGQVAEIMNKEYCGEFIRY